MSSEGHGDLESTAAPEPERSLVGALLDRAREGLGDPGRVLALVFLAAFVSRAAWITQPGSGLIFDESYYVNASRVILGWDIPLAGHYAEDPAGLDPNDEHPPLGKLLMAASMAVFGDNGLGWRLPSLLAGMVSLLALYLVVRAAGESRWFGVLAVGLFAFDNLSLVHGRIGTLDMMVLAPLLLGAWLALERRWFAAGLLMGLGTLVKLTGLYGLAALLLWLAIEHLMRWRSQGRIDLAFVRPVGLLVAGFVLVFGAGLTALDARFSPWKNPLDHVRHMVTYGTLLLRPDDVVGHCESPDSAPWQWLVNDCQITYLRVDVTSRADGEVVAKHAKIDFRGAMNPVLLAGLWLAFPMAAWLAWRRQSRVATWALVWAAASYLPFVVLAIFQSRITYIYYFLPVVPALAVAVAALLLRSSLPRLVTGSFLVAFLAAVAAYYPFRQIP